MAASGALNGMLRARTHGWGHSANETGVWQAPGAEGRGMACALLSSAQGIDGKNAAGSAPQVIPRLAATTAAVSEATTADA